MKFLTLHVFLLFLAFCYTPAFAQHNRWPKPPEAADKSSDTSNTPSAPRFHVDPVQLQREAKELLELSQSLQPDIEHVNHGLLPKDTIEKLKRIEKLSKHLRGELAP